MDARTEALEKAVTAKLRVKVESPEVQEVLKQLGYITSDAGITRKYITDDHAYIGIYEDGVIRMFGTKHFDKVAVEQRYQVELYLLIITGITTFE